MKNKEKISFFALGGLGEIGLNSYVYNIYNELENEGIIVDLGIGFNEFKSISADTFFPDIFVLNELKMKINGLLITHGHEDHIGAIGVLCQYLQCPIYATPWTADLILEKLKEYKLEQKAEIIIVKPDHFYEIGKFQVKWLEVSHSIPDCSLLFIKTQMGNIIHSGDFKINYEEEEILKSFDKIGKEKIKYLFCDSTNVMVEGVSKSESSIKKDLKKLVTQSKGACWITTFSSNLYRLDTICAIARDLKKKVVLLGRSVNQYVKIGIKHGYLDDDVFIEEDEIKETPRNKLIFIASGSQGEYRSVLSNILVGGGYRHKIEAGDTVIFSSKVIPGNELRVNRYYNVLSERDIDFYTAEDYNIHVSGHAKIEDLKLFYSKIKPQCVVPIHGESRHLREHVKFANKLGSDAYYLLNGEILDITEDIPTIIGQISYGKLVYEGGRLLNINSDIFKRKNKIFNEGVLFITIAFHYKSILAPVISSEGLLTKEEEIIYYEQLSNKIQNYVLSTFSKGELSDEALVEEIRILSRKFFKEILGKKPIVNIHFIK